MASVTLPKPRQSSLAHVIDVDLFKLTVTALLFLAFFANSIDIEAANLKNEVKIGLNPMAVVKALFVAAAGVLGAIGWWRLAAVRRLFTTLPGVLAVIFAGFYVFTWPVSIHRPVSIVAAIAFCSYLLFIPTALVSLGTVRAMYTALIALLALMIVAWVCYLAVPSVGVFHEYAGAQGEVLRMTGLAHPNAFGSNMGLFVVMAIAAAQMDRKWAIHWSFIAILGLATIAATLSRTAMIACLLGTFFANRHWIFHRYVVPVLMLSGLIAAIGVIYVDAEYGLDRITKKVLVSASKTKDANEITSATGRTEIWRYTCELIQERPAFGYGANTSPILLKNHSFQTHNIVLNPALSFGVFAMTVLVIWLILNLYWAIRSQNRFVVGVGFFIVISGFTEDTLLSTFPEPATLAWLMISFLPYMAFAESTSEEPADRRIVPLPA